MTPDLDSTLFVARSATFGRPDDRHVGNARRCQLARRSSLVGSPEDIAAERARQLKVLTDRHTAMLANATDPVLHALLEAHGPQGSPLWPDCQECPERDGFAGSSDPARWPCGVWLFISDRMETP